DGTRRGHRPPNEVARASEWQWSGIIHRLGGAGRVAHARRFGRFPDRVQKPGAVGREFVPRDADDPPHDFSKIQSRGERLQNRGEQSIAGLETPPDDRTQLGVIAVAFRKLKYSSRRLLAFGSVAEALPRPRGANDNQAKALPLQKIEGLPFRTGHDWGKAQRRNDFCWRFRRRFCGDNQNLIGHRRGIEGSSAPMLTEIECAACLSAPSMS